METGELPGLSGDAAGVCGDSFKPFDTANGKDLLKDYGGKSTGSGGSSGGNSNGGGDSSSGGNNDGRDRSSGRSDRGDTYEGRTSTARAEGAGGSNGSGRNSSDFLNRRGRQARAQVGEVKDEKNFTGSTAARKRPRMVGNLPVAQTSDRRTLDRSFYAERDQVDRSAPAQQPAAPDSDNESLEKKKVSYSVKRETASKEEKSEGFSIGELLRFLLIAAIIIALGMLLLGQGAQISKSWEK